MSGLAKFVHRDGRRAKQALDDLVMAWARDTKYGEPRYILELDSQHRGAKCGCECQSCGLALTAINAARDEFIKRPHFRHPEGAQRDACLILASRAAALRQLQVDGWLDLPRRQMSARATGLSGEIHEAWVELPPERVRITEVDFRDRAVAMLTLEDGRQLRVELTGTLDAGADLMFDSAGHPVPTILLAIDDPSLAGMAPDELRRRLKLLPSDLCWRAHWHDISLGGQAAAAARDKALFYFDEVPDGLELPTDLDPALKRQTVLHHEAMKLLAQSRQLRVPGWIAEAEAEFSDGQVIRRRFDADPDLLTLDLIELEQRFDHIVPDITCKAWPAEGGTVLWPFFIEITVTNEIAAERLDRIRAVGQPTLEIDLSLAGGRIDREGLRQMVVEELVLKRWLFHPEQARRTAALESELAGEVSATQAAAARRAELRAISMADLAARYLDAALQLADAQSIEGPDGRQPAAAAEEARAAQATLVDVVGALEARGYPEAGDANLLGGHGIITRILSIQLARPVGYRMENVAGVLNAIAQSKGVRLAETSIYLIAVRAYNPSFTAKQRAWFEAWAGKVRSSLMLGESTYLRDPSYDRLLSMLFPEMAPMLASRGAKRQLEAAPAYGDWRASKREGVPTRHRALFLEKSSRVSGGSQQYLDTRPGDQWLRGRDLDAWKRANPESARRWFGDEIESGTSPAARPDSI